MVYSGYLSLSMFRYFRSLNNEDSFPRKIHVCFIKPEYVFHTFHTMLLLLSVLVKLTFFNIFYIWSSHLKVENLENSFLFEDLKQFSCFSKSKIMIKSCLLYYSYLFRINYNITLLQQFPVPPWQKLKKYYKIKIKILLYYMHSGIYNTYKYSTIQRRVNRIKGVKSLHPSKKSRSSDVGIFEIFAIIIL